MEEDRRRAFHRSTPGWTREQKQQQGRLVNQFACLRGGVNEMMTHQNLSQAVTVDVEDLVVLGTAHTNEHGCVATELCSARLNFREGQLLTIESTTYVSPPVPEALQQTPADSERKFFKNILMWGPMTHRVVCTAYCFEPGFGLPNSVPCNRYICSVLIDS